VAVLAERGTVAITIYNEVDTVIVTRPIVQNQEHRVKIFIKNICLTVITSSYLCFSVPALADEAKPSTFRSIKKKTISACGWALLLTGAAALASATVDSVGTSMRLSSIERNDTGLDSSEIAELRLTNGLAPQKLVLGLLVMTLGYYVIKGNGLGYFEKIDSSSEDRDE
jgi:hypothetical protein